MTKEKRNSEPELKLWDSPVTTKKYTKNRKTGQLDLLWGCLLYTSNSLYKHFSSKDEIVEAMYQFLREQSKKNANIKPVDFSQLFQGKTAYEVLQGVVQGYVNMNHQEKLLTFYKVIYSERSIQPMAARIVAEETERMIIATKQLFYAMEIHKLLHFENADMSAVSFAMASRQGRMKKVLYARQRLMFV